MHHRIYLDVFDDVTKSSYVMGCTLPAQIGKQPSEANQVLLDPIHDRISRIHGVIEEVPGRGFVYLDRSTNGSRVDGLVLRNARKILGSGFEIQIENYRIRHVPRPESLILIHTNGQLQVQDKREILPGRGIGIKHDAEGCRLSDLDRWTEWHEPSMVRVALENKIPTLVAIEHRKTALLRVNNDPLDGTSRALRPGDVVGIDGERFALLPLNQKHIVCGNAACRLINDYQFEANCKWCGFHLGATGGGSIVIEETIR